MSVIGAAQSCEALTEEFRLKNLPSRGEKLRFVGVGERDVYNITAPFEDDGEEVIAARVEARDSEYSDVMFFVQTDNVWRPRQNQQVFRTLQDPFVTRVGGELVFGGVEVWSNPLQSGMLEYRTVFYRGRRVGDLRFFAAGPQWMKDIRLVELKDGRIGVFTRPKEQSWGSRIGWTVIDDLSQLTPGVIVNAPMLPNLFAQGEWGGVNEPRLLEDGRVGVLGHIAYRSRNENNSAQNLHYRAMAFVFDSATLEVSPIRIIAERSCFPFGESKRPELADVIFSGGLTRHPDSSATLYVGVGDAEAHKIKISDPFADVLQLL